MTDLNPSSPATVGLEWKPARAFPVRLSRQQLVGARIVSTATESIAAIRARMTSGSATPIQVAMDIYDLADPLADDNHRAIVRPGATFSNAAGWAMEGPGGSANYSASAYLMVNDVVGTNDPVSTGADTRLNYAGVTGPNPAQILFKAQGPNYYDGETGALGAALLDQRISAVDVVAICESGVGGAARFEGYLNIGGTNRYASDSGPIVVRGPGVLTRCRFRFNTNPATGQNWRNEDIDTLTHTGGSSGFGVAVINKTTPFVAAVTVLQLEFLCQPERRVAAGYATLTPNKSQWADFLIEDPDTGTHVNWAKESGSIYAVVFSLVADGGAASLATMDAQNIVGHELDLLDGGNFRAMIVPASNGIQSASASFGQEAPAVFLRTPTAVTSPDSQPYCIAEPREVGSGTCRQQLPVTSGTFGVVTAVISKKNSAPPTAALTIAIGASTISVAVSEVPNDNRYHVITRRLSSNAVLSGTSFIDFTSASGGWLVAVASVGTFGETGDASLAAAASVGGAATWAGTALPNSDAIVTAQTVPATLTGLTATPGHRTVANTQTGATTQIGHLALNWNSSSLGGTFDHYELQRLDDSVWTPLAYITLEASSFYYDQEARRGIAEQYRVRVVRGDLAVSDWSSTATATVPADTGCEWIFASNAVPNSAVAYEENGDAMPRALTRANASASVVHLIEGQDQPIAFRPTEGRSDIFQIPLIVAIDHPGTPATLGRAAFDPLISLVEDPAAPHIAVLDELGNRWSAFVEIVQGTQTWEMHEHQIQVKVTEVTSSVVTTDTPPTPT